jgi:hypothetical protein
MSTLTARQQALLESSPGIRLVQLTRFPKTTKELLVGVTGTRQATLEILKEDGKIERLKLAGVTRAQIEATIKRDKGKAEIDLRRPSIVTRGIAQKMLQRNTGKRPSFPIGLSSPS